MTIFHNNEQVEQGADPPVVAVPGQVMLTYCRVRGRGGGSVSHMGPATDH